MNRWSITLAVVALVALACQQAGPTSAIGTSIGTPLFANEDNNGNGNIHNVSVGGPDVDLAGPGGDKNFSLTGIVRADGTSDGEWVDMFGGGAGGIVVAVDCVNVSGDSATISGIIKNGTANGVDVTGQRALTRVWDRGKSANDPPDAISFSFFPVGVTCDFAGPLPANDMTRGQVTVN